MSESKTKEKLAEERLERYKQAPDSFLEINEIVAGVIHNPEAGKAMIPFIGKCKRSELEVAQSRLNFVIYKTFLNMDIEASMKQAAASQILQPNPIVKPGNNGSFKDRLNLK